MNLTTKNTQTHLDDSFCYVYNTVYGFNSKHHHQILEPHRKKKRKEKPNKQTDKSLTSYHEFFKSNSYDCSIHFNFNNYTYCVLANFPRLAKNR